MADTGATNPGTLINDSSQGTKTWQGATNAQTSNNSRSFCFSMYNNTTTQYLKVTNFGFSIPTDATIDGILVEVERRATSSDALKDLEVFIVKSDGNYGSENKADTGTTWPTSDAYVSYGNSTDLWSESWSYTDINDTDFGVGFRAIGAASANNDQPEVDHIRITVYYTETVAGVTRKIKIAGTFQDKPIKEKKAGTFQDKPIKIKVGGTFQDA